MGRRIQPDPEIVEKVVTCIKGPGSGYNRTHMKKQLLLSLILFSVSFSLFAKEPTHMNSVTFFGFDPITRYENEVLNPGVSLGQELYASFNDTIYAGAGFRYLFTREVKDDGQLTWQPIYAAVKLKIPGIKLPFFVKGAVGGCFVQANNSFKDGKNNLSGGLYYFAGAGIDLPFYYTDTVRFSFVFDMGYASYNGSYEDYTGKSENFEYTTLDMLAGLGISF